MMASPLLCGNDVRSMNDSTLQVLLDRDLIAINQDVLGKQAERSIRADHYDIWVKPLADGRKAVACFNRADTPRTIELNSKRWKTCLWSRCIVLTAVLWKMLRIT